MSKTVISIDTVRCALRSSCPFILFAFVNTPATTLNDLKTLQVWVYTDRHTDYPTAIARVLDALDAAAPGIECDLVILNSVDAPTRTNALVRTCLYVREGCDSIYWKFIERAGQEKHAGRLHPKLWKIDRGIEN
jgi:hypothetical protein